MRAGFQAAVELEHSIFVEEHRAVRLLDTTAANRQQLRYRRLLVAAGLRAANLATVELQSAFASDRIHDCQRETVLRQRIDQGALTAKLAQLGKRNRNESLAQLGLGRRPDRGER